MPCTTSTLEHMAWKFATEATYTYSYWFFIFFERTPETRYALLLGSALYLLLVEEPSHKSRTRKGFLDGGDFPGARLRPHDAYCGYSLLSCGSCLVSWCELFRYFKNRKE